MTMAGSAAIIFHSSCTLGCHALPSTDEGPGDEHRHTSHSSDRNVCMKWQTSLISMVGKSHLTCEACQTELNVWCWLSVSRLTAINAQSRKQVFHRLIFKRINFVSCETAVQQCTWWQETEPSTLADFISLLCFASFYYNHSRFIFVYNEKGVTKIKLKLLFVNRVSGQSLWLQYLYNFFFKWREKERESVCVCACVHTRTFYSRF